MIYHKTTKEHFEKFQKMIKDTNLTLKHDVYYLGYTKEELFELYRQDNNLNNIPLTMFDSYYFFLTPEIKKNINCLSYNCCCLKHLLIYEVLEIIPLFLEE